MSWEAGRINTGSLLLRSLRQIIAVREGDGTLAAPGMARRTAQPPWGALERLSITDVGQRNPAAAMALYSAGRSRPCCHVTIALDLVTQFANRG